MSRLPYTRLQLKSYIDRSRVGRTELPDVDTLSELHSAITNISNRLSPFQQWRTIALDNLYNDILYLSVSRTNDILLREKLQQLRGLLGVYSRVSMNVRKSRRKPRRKSPLKSVKKTKK